MRFTKRVLSLILAGAMAVSLVGRAVEVRRLRTDWMQMVNGSLLLALISVFLLQLEEAQIRLHVFAAKGMEATYGQTAVVNNLTGANGAIAANDLLSRIRRLPK